MVKCSRCEEYKPESDYYHRGMTPENSRLPDRRNVNCRACNDLLNPSQALKHASVEILESDEDFSDDDFSDNGRSESDEDNDEVSESDDDVADFNAENELSDDDHFSDESDYSDFSSDDDISDDDNISDSNSSDDSDSEDDDEVVPPLKRQKVATNSDFLTKNEFREIHLKSRIDVLNRLTMMDDRIDEQFNAMTARLNELEARETNRRRRIRRRDQFEEEWQ